MESLGKYIRKGISVATGAVLSYLILKTGLPLTPEQQLSVVAFVTTVVYSWVADFLKRFKWLDSEGYAARLRDKADADKLRGIPTSHLDSYQKKLLG